MVKLSEELRTLDADAGVRLECLRGGKKLLAFLTRFEQFYTVIVCPTKGNSWSMPEKPIEMKEFSSVEETIGYLKTLTGEKIRAYVY